MHYEPLIWKAIKRKKTSRFFLKDVLFFYLNFLSSLFQMRSMTFFFKSFVFIFKFIYQTISSVRLFTSILCLMIQIAHSRCEISRLVLVTTAHLLHSKYFIVRLYTLFRYSEYRYSPKFYFCIPKDTSSDFPIPISCLIIFSSLKY